MSIRFYEHDFDKISRTAGLPATDTISVAMFGKLARDTNTFQTFFGLTAGPGNDFQVFETDADGTTLNVFDGSGHQITGPALTVGSWYFLAYTSNGTTVNIYSSIITSSAALTNSSNTGAGAARGMTGLFVGGHDVAVEPLNGSICGLRVWDAVLSAADLENERWSLRPYRTANLNSFYPFLGVNEKYTDWGPNGRTMTGNRYGTWITEPNPPVSWRRDSHKLVISSQHPIGNTVALPYPF